MPNTLAELYAGLEPTREPYLRRARDAASLTIPTLFPEEAHDYRSDFDDPFQSVGSQGVNSVTSKWQLATFPPGLEFFEIQLDPKSVAEAETANRGNEIEKAKKAAALRAQILAYHMEDEAFRATLAEVYQNLAVGGSVLLREKSDKSGIRIHRLPSYVADFDNENHLLAVVVKERVSRRALPKLILEKIPESQENADVYTGWLKREGEDVFDTWQECEGQEVEDTRAEYPDRLSLPVWPARFDAPYGEAYGRGLVQRMIGDIASLEGLSQSSVELSAEAARLVWLHKPNGTTSPEMLAEAPNGSHRWGNVDDVGALKLDKNQDMQLTVATMAALRGDLQTNFFMRRSIQRDAERVTAVEVQTLAQELDETQGGAFSMLSVEVQLPILRITEMRLVRTGQLPQVKPNSGVKTRIIAGMEGLGRGIRLRQMQTFVASAAAVPTEAQLGYEVDRRKVIEELAQSSGVGMTYLRTTLEAGQLRAAEAKRARQEQLGPEAIRTGGQVLTTAMQQKP